MPRIKLTKTSTVYYNPILDGDASYYAEKDANTAEKMAVLDREAIDDDELSFDDLGDAESTWTITVTEDDGTTYDVDLPANDDEIFSKVNPNAKVIDDPEYQKVWDEYHADPNESEPEPTKVTEINDGVPGVNGDLLDDYS